MFDFTELDRFHNLFINAIQLAKKILPDVERGFVLSDEDFEVINNEIGEMYAGTEDIESLVIAEIDFNILSIEGESKSYLYAQKLYDKLQQVPTVNFSDDTSRWYLNMMVIERHSQKAIEKWCMKNEIERIPHDHYYAKWLRAMNGRIQNLEVVRRIFTKIEDHFKTTYWYLRYPERFGGDADPVGYTPIVYQPNSSEGLKLKWNCKPAVAGYIISELIRAGYIDPPTKDGDLNYKKMAVICNQIFEFKDYTPSPDSWRNVIDSERNTLPDIKRVKLKLPDLENLA
jgi:hypothetical protein